MFNRRRTTFSTRDFMESPTVSKKVVTVDRKAGIFAQGDPADSVMYVEEGAVKLSVIDKMGREGIMHIVGADEFIGESCLAEPFRGANASAIVPTTLLCIHKAEMIRLLHARQDFADRFLNHVLMRSIRAEESLVDQLFNPTEKRLARVLLLLTDGAYQSKSGLKISHEMLSEMVGATRARVSEFMFKFKKQGFIDYDEGLHVNSALLSVVLRD